ncbi:MAG: hypothetical protein ACFFDT_00265 [Candidatus Hodarchaeota archaeon]
MADPKTTPKNKIKSLNFSNLKEPAFKGTTLFLIGLFGASFLKIILGLINQEFVFRLTVAVPDPATFWLFVGLLVGSSIKLAAHLLLYISKTRKELDPNSTFLRLLLQNEDAKKILTFITENDIEFCWE